MWRPTCPSLSWERPAGQSSQSVRPVPLPKRPISQATQTDRDARDSHEHNKDVLGQARLDSTRQARRLRDEFRRLHGARKTAGGVRWIRGPMLRREGALTFVAHGVGFAGETTRLRETGHDSVMTSPKQQQNRINTSSDDSHNTCLSSACLPRICRRPSGPRGLRTGLAGKACSLPVRPAIGLSPEGKPVWNARDKGCLHGLSCTETDRQPWL